MSTKVKTVIAGRNTEDIHIYRSWGGCRPPRPPTPAKTAEAQSESKIFAVGSGGEAAAPGDRYMYMVSGPLNGPKKDKAH